ncbi:hypothetical protein EDD22DRAFT_848873 [Suillus occidentalis]|nr:hypothetical protein EDD22DRAFT_848873 [Suillus occidentalis]
MDDDPLPIIRFLPNGIYTMDTTSDTLPNHPLFHDALMMPNLTAPLGPLHSLNGSSALGHDASLMPNGLHSFNGSSVLGHDASLMPNGLHTFNGSSALGHDASLMPNGLYTFNGSSVLDYADAPLHPTPPSGSHFNNVFNVDMPLHADAPLHPTSPFGSYSNVVSIADAPLHPTSPFGLHLTNFSNVHVPSHSNISFGSPFNNYPNTFGTRTSDVLFTSHHTNGPFAQVPLTSDESFGSPYADLAHAHAPPQLIGLPNADHPYAAMSHMPNGTYGLSHSVSSLDLGNGAVPPMANTTTDNYLHQHTATLDECDTCNVLSAFNEPCSDPDLTTVPDLAPRPTDSLIPRIDTILESVQAGDFAHQEHQGQGTLVKEEPEEGEILETGDTKGSHFNGFYGGQEHSPALYSLLTNILTQVAHNERTKQDEGIHSRSSTASTPPAVSANVSSHLMVTFEDEIDYRDHNSVDVFYMRPSTDELPSYMPAPELARTNLVTPPNSETGLSTIYEDEYMPSLAPSQTFIPESSVREDDNIEERSPTPHQCQVPFRITVSLISTDDEKFHSMDSLKMMPKHI